MWRLGVSAGGAWQALHTDSLPEPEACPGTGWEAGEVPAALGSTF